MDGVKADNPLGVLSTDISSARIDYSISISSFTNIDLPSQGVFILQVRIRPMNASIVYDIIPYSAERQELDFAGRLQPVSPIDGLSEPLLGHGDALQSRGFRIRYIREKVEIGDTFLVSIQGKWLQFLKGSVNGGSDSVPDLSIQVELLLVSSSTTDLSRIKEIECSVVAAGRAFLPLPNRMEYLRVPLSLVDNQDPELSLRDQEDTGDFFVTGSLELIIYSSFLRSDFNVHEQSIATYKEDISDLKQLNLSLNARYRDSVKFQLDLSKQFARPSTGSSILSEFLGEKWWNGLGFVEDLHSALFLHWNDLVQNASFNMDSLDALVLSWESRSYSQCADFLCSDSSASSQWGSLGTENTFADLMFWVRRSSLPRLQFFPYVPRTLTMCHHGTNHLIILVHGYHATPNDVRALRNALQCLLPKATVYSSKANVDQTDGDICDMGLRLAMEVVKMVNDGNNSLGSGCKISFISHSLGGLIVRAALPHLAQFRERLAMYLSMATPHTGIGNTLFSNGVSILRLLTNSDALSQLCLRDSDRIDDCCIARLGRSAGLSWFSRVIFAGAIQDGYTTLASTTLRVPIDDVLTNAIATRILDQIAPAAFQRVVIDLPVTTAITVDSLTGKSGHVKVLESPLSMVLIAISSFDVLTA